MQGNGRKEDTSLGKGVPTKHYTINELFNLSKLVQNTKRALWKKRNLFLRSKSSKSNVAAQNPNISPAHQIENFAWPSIERAVETELKGKEPHRIHARKNCKGNGKTQATTTQPMQ